MRTGVNVYTVLFLLSLTLSTGCSGIKSYPDIPEKNLHVKTKTDSGSIFTKVRTAVDIYKVDNECRTEYEGTVQLRDPQVDIGLPSDRLSYLVFVFANSGFLSSTSSTLGQETLLTPRTGYSYDIEMSYFEDIYNVEIMERGRRKKSKAREIDIRPLSACNPR